jgi:hypothetical protein
MLFRLGGIDDSVASPEHPFPNPIAPETGGGYLELGAMSPSTRVGQLPGNFLP